jgi:hypothetical protein
MNSNSSVESSGSCFPASPIMGAQAVVATLATPATPATPATLTTEQIEASKCSVAYVNGLRSAPVGVLLYFFVEGRKFVLTRLIETGHLDLFHGTMNYGEKATDAARRILFQQTSGIFNLPATPLLLSPAFLAPDGVCYFAIEVDYHAVHARCELFPRYWTARNIRNQTYYTDTQLLVPYPASSTKEEREPKPVDNHEKVSLPFELIEGAITPPEYVYKALNGVRYFTHLPVLKNKTVFNFLMNVTRSK